MTTYRFNFHIFTKTVEQCCMQPVPGKGYVKITTDSNMTVQIVINQTFYLTELINISINIRMTIFIW